MQNNDVTTKSFTNNACRITEMNYETGGEEGCMHALISQLQ